MSPVDPVSTSLMLATLVGFGMLIYHARLTRRLRTVLEHSPLIYSPEDIPAGVDLREVIARPRLAYFTLAITGTGIRIVFTLLVLMFVGGMSGPNAPFGVIVTALSVAVLLWAPEFVAAREDSDVPLGAFDARVISLLRYATRMIPAAAGTQADLEDSREGARNGAEGTERSGDGSPDILSTIDGQRVFDAGHRRILEGLIGLRNRTVGQVMVPREKMVVVNAGWSVSRAACTVADSGYARIPVTERDGGQIVGLVHTKDLLLMLHSNQDGAFVKSVQREVSYVPATRRLDQLLRDFQTRREHVAVVQDEYGDPAGFITMDDILQSALSGEENGEGS